MRLGRKLMSVRVTIDEQRDQTKLDICLFPPSGLTLCCTGRWSGQSGIVPVPVTTRVNRHGLLPLLPGARNPIANRN